MKISHIEEIPEQLRIHQHRKGTFRYRRLAEGEPGTPGNFLLELVQTTDDFFSPRHRHNFDQFRYQVDGEFDFDRNGRMKPGVIGYFPEGTPYGPQTSSVRSLTLVLQFGGASGSGYMTQAEMEAGTEQLKKQGVFEKGAFRRNEDVEGKRNTDGYQAVWEFVNKRPMVYPKPRYHDPLMMEPSHFEWVPVDGAPGVCDKLMGVFSERHTEARFLRLEPGATFRVRGRRLCFVLDGSGSIAGRTYSKHTTVSCDDREEAEFVAAAPTEILVLGLPKLDGAVQHAAAAAE
ncbi:MAG: hypothetical protein HY246_09340 [Proteobacteria bacterium]|nr:hypothetical protein [Pseudomonadota bacterium]